jgi:hypothetical protein
MGFPVAMRQTTWDVLLRWALLAGGVFDILFGVAVLIAWRGFLSLLRIPQPENPAFVKIAAVLAIGVGLMIVIAGLAPWRHPANVTAAAVIRLLNSGVLLWLIFGPVRCLPLHIVAFAAVEGLLGVLHFIYSRRIASAVAGAQ